MKIEPKEIDAIIESVSELKKKVSFELEELKKRYQTLIRLETKLKGGKQTQEGETNG